MNEGQAARAFAVQTLKAAAGVVAAVAARVYAFQAPQGPPPTPFPYLILVPSGGQVENAQGKQNGRVFALPLMLVKAVCDGVSALPADQAFAAADVALQGAQGNLTLGGQAYRVTCMGEQSPFEQVERVDGLSYFHVGAYYRWIVERG